MTLNNSLPNLYKKDFPGFCSVYASFNEACLKNPSAISNGFVKKDDGSVDVNIGNITSNVSKADLEAFNNSIFISDKKPSNNGYSDAELFTVAYIESQAKVNLADLKPKKLNEIVNYFSGGLPEELFSQMTGKFEFANLSNNSGPIMKDSKNYNECLTNFNKFLDKNDYKNNYLVAITPTTGFGTRKENSSGFYTYTTMDPSSNIVTDHCYSVINVDKENEKIILHDSNMADITKNVNGRNYVNGEFELTFEEFFKYFNTLQVFSASK